jgi:hypothetical protein
MTVLSIQYLIIIATQTEVLRSVSRDSATLCHPTGRSTPTAIRILRPATHKPGTRNERRPGREKSSLTTERDPTRVTSNYVTALTRTRCAHTQAEGRSRISLRFLWASVGERLSKHMYVPPIYKYH